MLSAKDVLLGQKHTNRKSVTRNYRDGGVGKLTFFLFIFYGGVNDEHIRRSAFLLLKSPKNGLCLAKSDFARTWKLF